MINAYEKTAENRRLVKLSNRKKERFYAVSKPIPYEKSRGIK